MPILKINDTEFDLEALPAEARAKARMLQLADQEIERLQAQLAIAQTARGAYSQALKQLLPAAADAAPASGGALKFN